MSLSLKHLDSIVKSGFPFWTFCTELNKAGGKSAQKATRLFSTLLAGVEAQFREFRPRSEAQTNAVHFVSALEGVTVLANSLKNPALIEMESDQLLSWIRSL